MKEKEKGRHGKERENTREKVEEKDTQRKISVEEAEELKRLTQLQPLLREIQRDTAEWKKGEEECKAMVAKLKAKEEDQE